MSTFRDGDLVRYTPANTWCHHGIAKVTIGSDGKAKATDTYWGDSPTDGSWVDLAELSPAKIIGNVHEFGEVPYPYSFEDFREEDRYWIPMGGGSAKKRVRLGAEPELWRIEERLKSSVENAEAAVRSAANNLDWVRKQLTEHINAHGSLPRPSEEANG